MSWRRVKEGWGLERIPRELGDGTCTIPGPHTGREALYTTAPLPTSQSPKIYDRQMEEIRRTTLCRHHALWLYGE